MHRSTRHRTADAVLDRFCGAYRRACLDFIHLRPSAFICGKETTVSGPDVNHPLLIRSTNSAIRVAAVVLALVASAAPAQELYIWTDAEGIRHVADRRPDGDYEVEVQRAIAQPDAPVDMTNAGTERAPRWRFRNRLHGPVAVEVRVPESDNVVTDPPLPAVLVLAPKASREVLLGPLQERRSWRYAIEMSAMPGDPAARPDAGHVYRFPLPPGDAASIAQGFGGRFSHTAPHSRHAVDFAVPVGTPVFAARDGTVMDLEAYFHQAGDDPERDGPRANYVRVLHDDGSMAVYAHLDYNSIRVRPGQRVAAGDRLAASGNTGYSTGPHLHFAVQVNRDMQLVTIPFRMAGPDGRALALDRAGAADGR